MQNSLPIRVLVEVFSLLRGAERVSRLALCQRLELPPRELSRALAELEREGLLDAARLRLTLPGLAVAVAARRARRERPRTTRRAA